MIKSDYELNIARHAGQVGMAMMEAAKKTIGNNVNFMFLARCSTMQLNFAISSPKRIVGILN